MADDSQAVEAPIHPMGAEPPPQDVDVEELEPKVAPALSHEERIVVLREVQALLQKLGGKSLFLHTPKKGGAFVLSNGTSPGVPAIMKQYVDRNPDLPELFALICYTTAPSLGPVMQQLASIESNLLAVAQLVAQVAGVQMSVQEARPSGLVVPKGAV